MIGSIIMFKSKLLTWRDTPLTNHSNLPTTRTKPVLPSRPLSTFCFAGALGRNLRITVESNGKMSYNNGTQRQHMCWYTKNRGQAKLRLTMVAPQQRLEHTSSPDSSPGAEKVNAKTCIYIYIMEWCCSWHFLLPQPNSLIGGFGSSKHPKHMCQFQPYRETDTDIYILYTHIPSQLEVRNNKHGGNNLRYPYTPEKTTTTRRSILGLPTIKCWPCSAGSSMICIFLRVHDFSQMSANPVESVQYNGWV